MSAGIGAGITLLETKDSMDVVAVPSLYTAMVASPKQGSWAVPDGIGKVFVSDLSDGRFAVDYFYNAGTYSIATHGLGSESWPALTAAV